MALSAEKITFVCGMPNMDFARTTQMLAQAYWSPGITRREVEQGAQNSALVAGLFADGRQIGYGRVISDKTRFAYVLDIYIDEPFRGRGLGKQLIEYILQHHELADVTQWFLITRNAHGLYEKCGFVPMTRTEDWMEIRKAKPVPAVAPENERG